MPYYPKEVIEKAKEMDLLTYLQNYEPDELVHFSGDTYCTKEHDSLKISNGLWCWNSRGIGGKSAVKYLTDVKGYSFIDAVKIIVEKEKLQPPVKAIAPKKKRVYNLKLPPKSPTDDKVKEYLTGRGIDESIIDYCLEHNLIFESLPYHNAVFVGYDLNGIPRHAHKRGTVTSNSYKGNVAGSQPEFSFHWHGTSDKIFLFEAPIDMLSFISMHKENWKNHSYAASCSVSDRVLFQCLKDNPNIKNVFLCFDNDKAGQTANKRISDKLNSMNIQNEILIPIHKDWNEDILNGERTDEICRQVL